MTDYESSKLVNEYINIGFQVVQRLSGFEGCCELKGLREGFQPPLDKWK